MDWNMDWNKRFDLKFFISYNVVTLSQIVFERNSEEIDTYRS